jgi:16S rRNA (guanine(966)-N(2))-methyltransferase RsmD
LRIISGSAKGKRLAGFSGTLIRPTSDRVREALFSALYSHLGRFEGKTVLDLFAGTGALGLEALSRGAKMAVMVDQGAQAVQLIAANARACNLQEKVILMRGDVLKKLPTLVARGPFDLIFLDPPYALGLIEATLTIIADLGLAAKGGLVCAEGGARDPLPEEVGNLDCIIRRRYGSTVIGLYSLSRTEA